MKLENLITVNEVLVKPKGFKNYHLMKVTRTLEGFTISNYCAGKIGGHEFLYKVNKQSDLDALDVSF